MNRQIAYRFYRKTVLFASYVSVGGPNHWRMEGWNKILSVERDPDWCPTPNGKHIYWLRHHKALPDVVRGGDPRNELGLYKLDLAGPYCVHANNDPNVIGGYTLGCIQFGNADLDHIVHTGIKEGDYVFVHAG